LGLKAVALYRDGCKASQPLSTSSKESKDEAREAKESRESREKKSDVTIAAKAASELPLAPAPLTASDDTQLALRLNPPGTRLYGERVRLPKKRMGFTQEARVGGHKIFLRTGEYADGRLGEIFIDMHKEGAAFRSLMNCFAMSVSIGLQYGVPLQTFVEQFTFTRFEPQGLVEGHPYVKFSTSIVDYLFRVLGIEYLHRHDLAHVKPEEAASPLTSTADRGSVASLTADTGEQSLNYTKDAVARSAAMNEGLEASRATLTFPGVEGGTSTGSPLDAQLDAMMGDAPVCDVCGHITVRNGACYKCLNCGNSMGCS
jgi:ribonucleoside-diphosphate reductase alpha chain